MKRLLIIALLIAGCSSDDSPDNDNCNCDQMDFRYTVNASQNEFQEFSRFTCRSFWEDAGYTIDNGVILEATENSYNSAHENFYKCN